MILGFVLRMLGFGLFVSPANTHLKSDVWHCASFSLIPVASSPLKGSLSPTRASILSLPTPEMDVGMICEYLECCNKVMPASVGTSSSH
jgi:hypothetical protein